jgi:membrane protease YdiL (CAAX protease family)
MVLLGGGIVAGLIAYYGLPVGQAGAIFEGMGQRQQLRLVLLFNNLFTFGLSAFFGLYLTYRNWWSVAAGLVAPARPRLVSLSLVTFLVGLPAISLVGYLNLQLDLPEWMVQSEATGNATLAGVLTFDSLPELLMALLTVAVIPGFCEELMFRGVLQKRLLGAVMSDHLAVWVAAALFSAIHIEFAGFLPRLLLGALLGYAYRWTGSLWVPVIIHLLFNGTQVVVTYFSGEFAPDTQMDAEWLPLVISGGISAVLLVILIYYGEQVRRSMLQEKR